MARVPMECNICHQNEATVFLTQMNEGKFQKIDLCESCAKEKGIDDPTGYSLADLLMGIEPPPAVSEAPSEDTDSDLSSEEPVQGICPECGYTPAALKKHGRLGCPRCYETFGRILRPMLRSVQKSLTHMGKIPTVIHNPRALKAQIEDLQTQLDIAVDEERFEDAVVIRDKLKEIVEQLNQVQSTSAS